MDSANGPVQSGEMACLMVWYGIHQWRGGVDPGNRARLNPVKRDQPSSSPRLL